MSNPVLDSNPIFSGKNKAGETIDVQSLERQYDMPAAGTTLKTMTYDSVIMRTAFLLLVVVASSVVGLMAPALMLPSLLVGLVLGFVNAFKKQPSPVLITMYALAEGVMLGALSGLLEQRFPGLAMQAVLATFVTTGVVLALFASGKIRASRRLTKIFTVAIVSYIAFSLINLGLQMFNVVQNPWGVAGMTIMGIPLGVIIGALAICLAAYSLVLDFDYVRRGVAAKAPRAFAWTAAFGITVTLIWLYTEFLRLFAILRSN